MPAFVWAAALALAVAGEPPLSWESVWKSARPGAEELAVEAELAAARRALAETARNWADGPTLGATAGPRRSEEGSVQPDVSLDLDLPLLARPGGGQRRAAVEEVYRSAEPALRAAAVIERRRQVAAAYVEAWAAGQVQVVRAEDVATLERWAGITGRRVEEGAAAPYEQDLLEVELNQARSALALAESETRRSELQLAALARLPEPRPLAEPPVPPAPSGAEGALFQAVERRAALGEAIVRLEAARSQSRLALRSSLAREGEETVARFGIGYRFPRRAENAAVESAVDSQIASLRREAELRRAELTARLEAARVVVARPPAADLPAERALAALELRLTEGKAPASEVLPLRRGLLAAQQAWIEQRAAFFRAAYELEALASEVQP